MLDSELDLHDSTEAMLANDVVTSPSFSLLRRTRQVKEVHPTPVRAEDAIEMVEFDLEVLSVIFPSHLRGVPLLLDFIVCLVSHIYVLPGPPNNANLLTILGPTSSYSALV